MRLKGKKIGFAVTGSHCTLEKVIPPLENLKSEGADIHIILSESILNNDTKYGKAKDWYEKFSKVSGNSIITSIIEAEPIGPQNYLDCIVVAPCTGNTIAKFANGITDSTVLMAMKAQLRNAKPVVIAISTNDGLGNNLKNIAQLLNTKNIYFVPFKQDNPFVKYNSLMANMDLIVDTVIHSLEGKQIQPVLDR